MVSALLPAAAQQEMTIKLGDPWVAGKNLLVKLQARRAAVPDLLGDIS